MARRIQEDDRKPIRRAVRKKRSWLGLLAVLALVGLIVCLPQIATNRTVLTSLIDRFAGIAPLKLRVERVQVGWFSPLQAHGIRLLDEDGQVLAQIHEVATEKGLWNWMTSSSQLGKIRISQLEAAIVAENATTNLEQALAPVLARWASEETSSEDTATSTGTIELVDAKLLVVEAGRPEQWVLQISQLSATLPDATQVIGPIQLEASVGEVSGTVADSLGSIVAAIQEADGRFEVHAELQHVPMDFWHVVHARLPDIPINEVHGRLSGTLAGNLRDAGHWDFDVRQLETTELSIDAPQIVGTEPARIALVAAAGRASLADTGLSIEDAQLACDFGSATASGRLPWPINFPTAANPFLDGAELQAKGAVDLPKLVAAAESLLPVRNDAQLLAGTAQFEVSQTLDAQGLPGSRAKLTLAGLRAQASGQDLTWNEPLEIEVTAARKLSGLQVDGSALAEFCSLQGGGSLTSGQFGGNVDLELLHQRLSQWMELPIRTMTGSAKLGVSWNLTESTLLDAQGTLSTTPLLIATTTGGEIKEPAWEGVFSAKTRLQQGTPTHIDQAHVELSALEEKLTLDLQEPLALSTESTATANTPPAAFTLTLVGDLASWQRRGFVWLSEPPEMDLNGNMNLAVGGRIDLNHVEIYQANWRSQPIRVWTPQLSVSEAQMVGNFKGRIDTADLRRLQVEQLQVQATSFSIGAQDAASSDGNGRVGQASFLVDLSQLLRNMQTEAARPVLPPGNSVATASAQTSASGRVRGQLQWQVNAAGAGVALTAKGEQIALLSLTPTAPASTLWEEPQLDTQLTGSWNSETGAVDISNLKIDAPWCSYVGKLNYSSQGTVQSVAGTGQAVVDTAALSAKLAPMTGNQVQLLGQQTVPVELQWSSSADPAASVLAGLRGSTRIGWQQARVAGIDLGRADVPLVITDGQLATAAEIPVSGGVLRWDVTSDLTADQLVINQKPMKVLENVEITEEMCKGWLKYVAPLLAEATSVDGRLSLMLNQAKLTPANPRQQTVAGQLIMHSAEVGPGPLSNQIITLVRQLDAIRKREFAQAVSNQTVWLKMPEQKIDFEMVDGRVIHRNLNVRIGDVTLSTAGSVDVNGYMDMLATMPIPNDWADKSPLLAGLRGQSLQFPVRGTLSAPQVDGQALTQLGRQTVQSAAQGLLQQGLSRGFEKIFGAPPTTPNPNQPQP